MRRWLDRLFRRGRAPDDGWPFGDLIAQAQAGVARSTPVADLRFVVVDTETTGLDPRVDALLSIGAVAVSGGAVHVGDSFECLVAPPVASERGRAAVAVHGILPRRARDEGLPPEEAAATFLAWAGTAVLVGHHVAFDVAMLRRAAGGERLPHRTLDTALLALRLERFGAAAGSYRSEEYSLDAVCARYGIRVADRHTAAGDAFLTAQLLLKLLARAERRGIRTSRDLLGRRR